MPDVIVIGSGPGGAAAATRAAQLGAQVTLIEMEELGGNCVNRNCIPLVSMLSSVELFNRIKAADEMGISIGKPVLEVDQLVERARQISQEMSQGLASLLPSFGIEILTGQARILGAKTVEVGNYQLEADKAIILATGAVCAPLPEGIHADAILWPHIALDLDPIPERLLIWGGSGVELEFASLFNSVGSSITLLVEGAHPLPAEDYEVGQRLHEALREQGIEIITNASLKSAVKAGEEVQAVFVTRQGEDKLTVDRVLWAGRIPNTSRLGLEKLGVKQDARRGGAVVVDPYQQTNVPGVYAVGDITGEPFYSSVATVEGLVAAESIMGRRQKFDRKSIPRYAFTNPEVGCVGLTEEQAEDVGYEIDVINISLDTNSRAATLGQAEGGIKIIVNKKQGKILGVHIVGHRATELVAEAALAIQLEALAEDWAWSCRVHPSFSEAKLEGGRAALGQALYIPRF